MSKREKLLEKILSGEADANIRFDEISAFLQREGYSLHINGSHHVLRKPGWPSVVAQFEKYCRATASVAPVQAERPPYNSRQTEPLPGRRLTCSRVAGMLSRIK